MDYDRERLPIETARKVYEELSEEAATALLAAGKLSEEIRQLQDRMQEAARERRALMVSATDRDRKATYPIVKRMVGLGLSVVTREVRLGREERAETEKARKRRTVAAH